MKRIIFILTILCLFSCYEEIPFDYENTEPKLVLYGALTQDSIIRVEVNSSQIIDDTSSCHITDATVNLYINNEFAEKLTHDSAGIYISTTIAELSKTYKIEVIHKGFKTITATTIIPKKPIIDSCNYLFDFGSTQYGNKTSKIDVYMLDIQNISNYYYIPNILLNDTFFLSCKALDAVLLSEKDLISKFVFTDDLFENSNHKLEIEIEQPRRDSFDLYLKIQTVTEDFYKYKLNSFDYYYSQNNSYFDYNTEPIEIHTNVNNGFGLLYGYNQKIIIITHKITNK